MKTIAFITFAASAVGSSLMGCGESSGPPGAPTASAKPSATAPASASATPSASASTKTYSNGAKGPFPQSTDPKMRDPAAAKLKAPETFVARFETTAGNIAMKCTRAWAPHGADRLYNLLKIGFYDDVALYRVDPEFVVQWGIHGDPSLSKQWQESVIEPDAIKKKNTRGTVTFAQVGNPPSKGKTPLTRATQLFINLDDSPHLDNAFAPVCEVTEGMDTTKKLGGQAHHKHLKNAQSRIIELGNDFLRKNYPELDYIKKASVVEPASDAGAP